MVHGWMMIWGWEFAWLIGLIGAAAVAEIAVGELAHRKVAVTQLLLRRIH